MRKLICFLLLFIPLLSFSQETTISGNASFFKNEKIEVFEILNNIVKSKKLIAADTIGSDGNYNLNLNITKPQVIIIKIEMREISFHIHPSTNVTLDFLPFKNASNQRVPLKLKATYQNLPQNTAPDSIYYTLNNSFAKSQQDISLKISKLDLYKSFFSSTDSTYNKFITHDKLFQSYYTYFKANALLQTNTSRNQLISENIIDKEIQYDSDQYLKFFKSTMSVTVGKFLYKNPKLVEQAKNEFNIYIYLLNILSKDSRLKSKEIRSLALLYYIKGKSSNSLFNPETKASIINQCANFSNYKIQGEAARSIEKNSFSLRENMEAPLFSLNNKNNNSLDLHSLRSKPVYMGFIHSKSNTCQKDLIAIKSLQKKFRKMQFLLVVCDRDSIMENQIPKETNNLKVVYLNKSYEVLEKYQVWSFPVYFLIDKHGYFIQSPAKSPIEMFDDFAIMFAPKSKRKSYEIIHD